VRRADPDLGYPTVVMADDQDARSRQLAKQLLGALDREDDPDRLAYAVQKERDDRAALDRFYVQSGQKAAAGDAVVAVWDYASRPEATFSIGVLTRTSVQRYEHTKLPKRNRWATLAAMRRRGVLCAASYAAADYIWLVDERGFGVWSTKAGVVASANTDDVIVHGAQVPRRDVKAIHTFVGDDYVVRGLRIERADGVLLPLTYEGDPTYGRNELLESDARWIACCGRDLAIALRVPLVDPVFGVTVDPKLATVLCELAKRIEQLPAVGAFEPIEQAIAHGDRRALLRCAPSPNDPEKARFLELRLPSPSGQSTTSQWLLAGVIAELAAYLRWPETVEEVPQKLRDLVTSQQQHRMG
jgi:hypothetical protein